MFNKSVNVKIIGETVKYYIGEGQKSEWSGLKRE